MHPAATALGLEATVIGSTESPPTLADLPVFAALDRRIERHVPRWAGGYVLDPLVAGRLAETHLRDRVTPLCGPTTVVVASSVNPATTVRSHGGSTGSTRPKRPRLP